MTKVTDYQRSKCYSWEREVIAPKGGAWVNFDKAQDLVNWIWANEGFSFPPQVALIHTNNTTAEAQANRLEIQIRDRVQTWVILHELAHSMTSNIDGQTVAHRAPWVGIYMRLCEKYLGIPLLVLMATATKMGVDFDITARPAFVD